MKNWILTVLIPLIVPIAIQLLKVILPVMKKFIDDRKLTWIYPIIAAGIGVLIDWLGSLGAGTTVAAISGLAGVGLYDAANNIIKGK